MAGPITERLLQSGVVRVGTVLILAAVLAQSAAHFFGLAPMAGAAFLDFDAFYVVGLMAWDGNLAEAYSAQTLFEVQRRFSGVDGAMPWSYPPPFDLAVAGLALLPRGPAYLVFMLGSLGAYVWVMRRLAGPLAYPALLAIAPGLFLNIRAGQNGFLTGALVGGFCLLALRGRSAAGLPLGLMAIKPHLAVALGLWLVLARRWAAVAWAAAAVAAVSALATLAFGAGIWAAFLGGVAEAGGFLERGEYQLHRMTSLYAALASLGVPSAAALTAQAALALAACAAAGFAARKLVEPRHGLAVALCATLLVSPYSYDYDLTLFGLALALLAPEILARARDRDALALLALGWIASGSGLAAVTVPGAAPPPSATIGGGAVSIGFFAYIGLLALVAAVMRRPPLRSQ